MANRFEDSKLNDWAAVEKNPAAPVGLARGAQAAQGYGVAGNRFEDSQLGQWMSEKGPTQNAQSWYGGRNLDGTNNGWATEFWAKTMDQNKMLSEQGGLAKQFSRTDATGVVTWDHEDETDQGLKRFRFGDIYEDGEFKGNIYDQLEQPAADLMMADVLFDGETKAEIFSDSDRNNRLTREVQSERERRNVEIPKQLQAAEFQATTKERQEQFQEGVGVDEGIAGAGAAGGAAIGAGIGAAIGAPAFGVGAIPAAAAGAAVGALVGGVGAWFNRDTLSEQAARAYEITSLSNRTNGTAAAVGTGFSQWGGFAGRMLSPGSNLVQGLADTGHRGDGESEFYRVDEQGKREAPKWLQVADLGASVGDAMLQFASPIGAGLYMTQMGATIGGEVGELALSGGKSFDPRRGGFDNIFTDDEGNFDALSASAGIGKIGIDAVQMGMTRGLLNRADQLAGVAGKEATYAGAASGKIVTEKVAGKLPLWMGGTRGLKAGEQRVDAGVLRYTTDASGKIVPGSTRATLQILAPSEQLTALSARYIGRREAAKRAGGKTTYSADDFYAAVNSMRMGERKFTTALVNAFGEGYEEGIQEILEPLSHNGSIDGSDVFTSALYGGAMGLGMGLGTNLHTGSLDVRMYAQARANTLLLRGGSELTRDEWKTLDEVQKRALAARGPVEENVLSAAYRKVAEDQAMEQTADVVGVKKAVDGIQAKLKGTLAKATSRTDGAFLVAPMSDVAKVDQDGNLIPGPDSYAHDAAVTSGRQFAENFAQHMRGVDIQHDTLRERLQEAEQALSQDPTNPELTQERDARLNQAERAELTLRWGMVLSEEINAAMAAMYADTATFETRRADAEVLNQLLRSAFNLELPELQGQQLTPEDRRALANAVSQLWTRDPQDSSGSYTMLVPQVSPYLTDWGGDNMLQVSSGILQAMGADHDGDKLRPLNQIILDETEFISARSGAHLIGAGSSVNIGAPAYEQYVVRFLSDSINAGGTLATNATAALDKITDAITSRYQDLEIDPNELYTVLESFKASVRSGSDTARAMLLDQLAEHFGGQLTEFARGNLSNEWLWLDQLVQASLDEFQSAYAARRADQVEAPNQNIVAPHRRVSSKQVSERGTVRAATLGMTLGLILPGDSMFRKFQKLHYSVLGAPVEDADGNIEAPMGVQEMAQLYEALGQGLTESELSRIRSHDRITARVLAQLERLVKDAQRVHPQLNRAEATALVANMEVQDILYDADGTPNRLGAKLSLTQFLLKRSIQQDRQDQAAVWDNDPQLQAKHARLLSMTNPQSRDNPANAERAFVEVFGAQQLYTLIGDSAEIYGPHITVEQFVRRYASMNEDQRRDVDAAIRKEPTYLRARRKNIPYDIRDIKDETNPITPFQAVSDAMTATGRARIALDASHNPTGELGELSNNTSAQLQEAIDTIRQGLREFQGFTGRKDGELTPAMVRRMFELYPDFAKSAWNLILDQYTSAMFRAENDSVFVANWFYELFTLDAKAAEMHLWRNLLLMEMNSLGSRTDSNTDDDGETIRRQRDKLPRRMHRLLYDLRAGDKSGQRLSQFLVRMEQTQDLSEFIRWVNQTPEFRQGAPFTAWVDDTTQFDPHKAHGGWSTSIPGAELRESIRSLRDASSRLRDEIVAERAVEQHDARTQQKLRGVITDLRNGNQPSTQDMDLYNRFVKAIDNSSKLRVGLGPAAMLHQTTESAWGFYAQAHTKGANPEHVNPMGAIEAWRDAFDYTTNYERLMASLTSVNMDAVGSNLSELAKDGTRTMDDFGRPIEWELPSNDTDKAELFLNMLESAETRALARAVLFPQVMERGPDGQTRVQLLTGKSVTNWLDGSELKGLYADGDGYMTHDQALRYVSMVEALARKKENGSGNFSIQRAANERVIARLSKATRTLTYDDISRMTLDAYVEIAKELQAAAAVNTSTRTTDGLRQVWQKTKKAQREAQRMQLLRLSGEDRPLLDVFFEQHRTELETQLLKDQQQIDQQMAGTRDVGELERLQQAKELLEKTFQRATERMDAVQTDDLAAMAADIYSNHADPAVREKISEYLLMHPSMIQSVPGAQEELLAFFRLVNESATHGFIGPDAPVDWALLSRAVITDYLGDLTATTAPGVSQGLFPDEKHEADIKYLDPSYSYLADAVLDPDSPLVRAATELHAMAGRLDVVVNDSELIRLVGDQLFDSNRLGPWTSDIARQTDTSFKLLDSASAPQAITMPGNLPKRQPTISAATRRTFRKPTDEMLSTTVLTAKDLDTDPYDPMLVRFPNDNSQQSRPLLQLNNRFAKSVTVTPIGKTGANGEQLVIDLLAEDANLGRVFHGNDSVASSGYYEIHLDRIKNALGKAATRHGFDASQAVIEVQYFHPDTQPVDTVQGEETWYNNVYFEGTSFKLDADRFADLNSTLWFPAFGISPNTQAAALQASKKGLPALQVVDAVPAQERRQMEETALVDFAEMLRAKTKRLLQSNMGDIEIDPEYWNATYKNMKLRHFLRYADENGEAQLLTAEQVIALQIEGQELPAGAELYVPSDDVLRTMLGEQGTQGVARLLSDQLEVDVSRVPLYKGVTPRMLELFRAGVSGETATLETSRIANRGRQQQLQVRSQMSTADRSKFDERVLYFKRIEAEVQQDRPYIPGNQDGAVVNQALADAIQFAYDALSAEDLSLEFSAMGLPWIGPRNPADTFLTKDLLQQLHQSMAADNSRMGWIYREGGPTKPMQGLLSDAGLSTPPRNGLAVMPGDLVAFDLTSFEGQREKVLKRAKKRLDYLMGRGANIVLVQNDGRNDLRAELTTYLTQNYYQKLAGSKHAYAPIQSFSRFQNLAARESSLTEVRGISPKSRIAILQTQGLPIQESGLWIDKDNPRLRYVSVVADLVPVDANFEYNVPVSTLDNDSQMQQVRRHILGLDTEPGRRLLREQSNGHLNEGSPERKEADRQFNEDWQELITRITNTPDSVLPEAGQEFGKGKFIPLVSSRSTGTRVLLYRHGYVMPSPDDIATMQAQTLPNEFGALNVAVYPAKIESAATVRSGEVVRFDTRNGHGLQVEMNVDLQQLGDKVQLEMNGMKYVLVPKPGGRPLPDHGFFQNWGVDAISDMATLFSKEAYGDLVNNHRMAFAFFGVDFTDDVAEAFFPGHKTADPATQETNRRAVNEILDLVSQQNQSLPVAAADELISMMSLGETYRGMLESVAGRTSGLSDGSWVARVANPSTVEEQISAAMLVYLGTGGAKKEHVLRSGGFNDEGSNLSDQSILMPQLFTQLFDNAAIGSDLRTEMFRRFNDQLYNPNTDGSGYRLDQTWDFHALHADPEKSMVGLLQVPEVHSSGDNPIKNGMAFDPTSKSSVSQHSANIVYGATGGETAYKFDIGRAQAYAKGEGIVQFSTELVDGKRRGVLDGNVWQLLTKIPDADANKAQPWRVDPPLAAEYVRTARDAMIQYRKPIEQLDEYGWNDQQRTQYNNLVQQILGWLNLDSAQVELIDYWVRQTLGDPQFTDDDGTIQGHPSGKAALEMAGEIWQNVREGYLPTVSAEVPVLHVSDLQLLFRKNRKASRAWTLRESFDNQAKAVGQNDWDGWVETALGTAVTADGYFDPIYLAAADGFVQTYRNATDALVDLPVSMDVLANEQLIDPENNMAFVSLDPANNRLINQPLVLDAQRATFEELLAGRRVDGTYKGRRAPAAEIAKKRARMRKWRKENGVPMPVDRTLRDLRKNGRSFIDYSTTTNALARSLLHLRVGTALINPALWVSMGPEQWVRGSLDRVANLLTGQSTGGLSAGLQARAGQKVEDAAERGSRAAQGLIEMGLVPAYSPEQIKSLRGLYEVLGQRKDFKSMLNQEMWYKQPHDPAIGKIERGLSSVAKFGSRMQDPTYGMKQTTLARRYMEAALQHIMATPTMHLVSVDTLVDQMQTDPQYLKSNFPEAHQFAVNAIAQIRSLKQTPISMWVRSIYEPLSESSHSGRNFFGNVVLKMPLIFSTYAINVATTITGLQGISDMYAMMVDGRKKGPNSLWGRMQAWMRGEQFDPSRDELIDMSPVIEGIDLSRSFIRGGLTHAGLFAFGLMAGGLGLGGEDDESKFRRRQAELQGAGYIYDPRQVQNDFRNADAIYLDWLPDVFSSWFRATDERGVNGARAMGQMHWMLKQFVSPIMGMEKFFETGDTRHVMWGFEEAVGSFPLINSLAWSDAVQTAEEFATMADGEAKLGGPSNLVGGAHFLTSMVGIYERMLFENSFVNTLYTSWDDYDRDPYKLPLRNNTGDINTDIEGNARPNDVALEQFIGENGQIGTGYLNRRQLDATLHSMTENRASLALMANLFTGVTGLGEADYFRRQMPIKTRKIDKAPTDIDTAKAVVAGAFAGAGGVPRLDQSEITQLLRQQAINSGQRYDMTQLDQQAAALAGQEGIAALSYIKDGREHLTKDGAWAVYQGLYKGTIGFSADSLRGVFITRDMREQIQKEWMEELIQEGVDLGLDQTKATSRMKRIWYGPTTDPSVLGLGEILWSKEISDQDSLTYNQLNTTYVVGPDGLPWATGYTRDGWKGALGIMPVKRMMLSESSATDTDDRINTVDLVNGINTGLRALEPVDESRFIMTDAEVAKSIENAIKDAAEKTYAPFTPYESKSSGGGYYRSRGGYGRRSSYGGGGYYSGSSYASKMQDLPRGMAPYANTVPFINTSNPIIRRADVRRERVWSERGRLKQWQ